MRQPRVPEYRENESTGKYLKSLVLFLKDFCSDVWAAERKAARSETDADMLGGKPSDDYALKQDVATKYALKEEVASNYALKNEVLPKSPHAIELSGGEGYGGYIDFHYGKSSKDFTARIIESPEGRIDIGPSLNVNGSLYVGGRYIGDVIYPIGSIYLSVSSTSPASLFGGIWEQLKDRFLLGAGGSYAAGGAGGESSHTLTTSEMPSHLHGLYGHAFNWGSNIPNTVFLSSSEAQAGTVIYNWAYTMYGAWDKTHPNGGNAAHNNMPPYLAVYMWKRVG